MLLIDAERHSFLRYDSYIDCTTLHEKPAADFITSISENPERVVGTVADDIVAKVHEKITFSKSIAKKSKRKFGFL